MKQRRGFTLVEMLVVIGIIVVLAGLLLPMLSRARRSAEMSWGRADLQTISVALDAYKADFGDYPRNTQLSTWSITNINTNPSHLPAPIFLTLATALLGPGPSITLVNNGVYQVGDGQDGQGIRCQVNSYPCTLFAPVAGTNTVTVTPSGLYTSQFSTFASTFVPATGTNPPSTAASLAISVGTVNQETIGIQKIRGPLGGNYILTLTTATDFNKTHLAGDACAMVAPTGKVWGPYLQPNQFRVATIPASDVNGNIIGPATSAGTANPIYAGQPVLLDRWGQVIQYFPRNGSFNNRSNDSSFGTPSGVNVFIGPLLGSSEPKSLEPTASFTPLLNTLLPIPGQNAIFDLREGAPFYAAIVDTSKPKAPAGRTNTVLGEMWPVQVTNPPTIVDKGVNNSTVDSDLVTPILWMLGDEDAENYIDKEVGYDGPFILISAGPDGPDGLDRTHGGFCNFATADQTYQSTGDKGLRANQYQQLFTKSGNIYNFDRP